MKSQARQNKVKCGRQVPSGPASSALVKDSTNGKDAGSLTTAEDGATTQSESCASGSSATKSVPGHAGMCCASDVHPHKAHGSSHDDAATHADYFNRLSLEVMCQILSYLPLRDVVRLESLNRRMHEAISMHLRLLRNIDFMEGEIYGWMSTGFTDSTFAKFLRRCPDVVNVYGLHLRSIAKRRQRVSEKLSLPGIIQALPLCTNLYGVETSDIFLLEAITNYLPHIHILQTFRNRNGSFPLCPSNRFELDRNPRITSLHLTGVVVPELPRMDFLQHIYLKWVKLTDPHPFRDFGVPLLRTFVMSNCAGPTNALKYVPLITGLAGAWHLSRLELVRVPFLGGLIQHVVEDSWRMYGFRQLTKVMFGTCKHALEVDLGYLVITCAHRLEELAVQPSLTKDSLFYSLTLADVDFPHFETLHLGYVDDFPEHGKWKNEDLVNQGLADIVESPAMITDIGMRAVGQVFPNVESLSIYNCPHLQLPMSWFTPVGQSWVRLKELHLRRCHALRLNDFCRMIPLLPSLESLFLEQMFREPPKGCSRVGLSAGTGLGVSSALVQNSGNEVPNPDAANNNGPAVPANPMQAHPPPAAAAAAPAAPPPPPPYPPPPLDAEDEVDNAEPPPGEAPFEQLLQPEQHPIVDHVNHADLSDPPLHNEPSPAVGPTANHPEPGTSTGRTARTKCRCGHSANSKQSPAGSSVPHGGHTDYSSDCHTQPARGRLKSSTSRPCRDNKEDSSPTRRSKRLRLSRGSAVNTGSNISSSSCAANHQESGQDSSSHTGEGISCSSKYSGKGKSLRGRKKGLVKRSASASTNALQESMSTTRPPSTESAPGARNRNQSCQAISEEIRESTKRAKEHAEAGRRKGGAAGFSSTCPIHSAADRPDSPAIPHLVDIDSDTAVPSPSVPDTEDGRPRRSMATQTGTRGAHQPSARSVGDRKPTTARKPHMCDQATSTSDPVIEEDHVQMLEIHSSTLMSLTLRQVGVTDLIISDCPKLQMLAGTACRVLKNVAIKGAPQLTRIQFAQCRKLHHQMVIDQVLRQPAERNRLIFLRPMQMYNPVTVERQLISCADYNYSVCLLQDYCANPELTIYNKTRATSWLDVIYSVNFDLLTEKKGFQKAVRKTSATPDYPYGRDIYRMQGESEGGHWWDVVTDFPWLRQLTAAKTIEQPRTFSEYDSKSGVYNPHVKCHNQTEICLETLRDDIAEAQHNRQRLYSYGALVYVNMCDLYGPPVTDKYV